MNLACFTTDHDCALNKRVNRAGGLFLLSFKSAVYAATIFTAMIGSLILIAAFLGLASYGLEGFSRAATYIYFTFRVSLVMSVVTIIPNLILLTILKEKLRKNPLGDSEQILKAGEKHGISVYKYSLIPFFVILIPAFPGGIFIVTLAVLLTLPLLFPVAIYAGRYTVHALVRLIESEAS